MTDIVERLAGTFRAEPAAQRVMDEDTDLITALRAEVEWYKEHSARVQEVTATYTRTIMQYRAETARLTARIRELEGALAMGIYEATHLSPQEPDGSHWAKISSDFLATARAALKGETNGN